MTNPTATCDADYIIVNERAPDGSPTRSHFNLDLLSDDITYKLIVAGRLSGQDGG
eukprot:CAMPEP_0180042794 /NCGR_PEP_ID=MMETSP0984-20121128/34935_1 /TAXON_ID=483367 /ORGANISM="non described non described, Strain CCMP 2436" /LENGTH=54 /DNA_ID=CAMNT_0021970629 /DNA_START=59 /DNA_END=219 /DNA_ORIENTATION=-